MFDHLESEMTSRVGLLESESGAGCEERESKAGGGWTVRQRGAVQEECW